MTSDIIDNSIKENKYEFLGVSTDDKWDRIKTVLRTQIKKVWILEKIQFYN